MTWGEHDHFFDLIKTVQGSRGLFSPFLTIEHVILKVGIDQLVREKGKWGALKASKAALTLF